MGDAELPVGFISKTLNKQEKKWHIYDKEAYSIFYALRKWDQLLRDTHFTLFTDHKNLTYLDKDPSARVQRWRMAVQQYSFDVAFLTSEENHVADAFSRLCPEELTEEEEVLSLQEMDEEFQDIQLELLVLQDVTKIRIPEDKYKIISACHNTNVGHFGSDLTETRVKNYLDNPPRERDQQAYQDLKLNWSASQIRSDVRTFIKQCPCCNKMHKIKLGIVTRNYTVTRYGLFQNICVDAIHMPLSKNKFKYILTFVDSFSRYVKLYALLDLTSLHAAECLWDFICTYGVPIAITSDNGSEFQKVFQDLMEIEKIQGLKIQAYSHEENSIVERTNKEVNRHIRDIVFDSSLVEEWDETLPLVSRITNSQIHRDTGLSASDIVFAGQVNLMSGLLQPHSKMQASTMPQYISKLLQYQQKILQIVKTKQDEKDAKHISTDTGRQQTTFAINTFVMAKYEANNGEPPTKLHPLLRGPYQIINRSIRAEGDIYTVQDLVTNKLYDFHVKLLQPYQYDATRINPLAVAMKDHNSSMESRVYIVEEVLNHRFFPNSVKAANLQLLIKWMNEDRPQWNSYNETSIKKVKLVQDYLYDNKLGAMVPQQYKRTVRMQKERVIENLTQSPNEKHYQLRQERKKKRLWTPM
jgi:hypothetical protein